jgi:opacity protein-like surface antigen
MGSNKFNAILAGILAVAASSTVRAADLLPPPPMMPEPVEFGGDWYLRGDVGVGMLNFDKTIARDVSSPSVPYNYRKIEDRIGDQVFVGGGIGYQVNSWLRFDVTGEYRTKADWTFTAQDLDSRPVGYNLTKGHFSSAVGLANAYIDLGTWHGITPFIGAGIGVAHHMFDSVSDQGLGAYTGGAAGTAGGFGIGRPKDTTELAWAVHAGVGYDVSHNLKLELAYRYLNMGSAETGVISCLPACPPANLKTAYKLKEVESHDFKIGMRWLLAGPVGYAHEPAPLMRRY